MIDDSIMIRRLQVIYGKESERSLIIPDVNPFFVNPDELIINGKVIWFTIVIDQKKGLNAL